MKALNFHHLLLSAGAAATFLAGCGTLQPPIQLPNDAADVGPSVSHHKMFHFTGKAQSFIVPKGVTQITVVASGASGPIIRSGSYCNVYGGMGGLVHATIPVRPSETLAVFVGGEGQVGGGLVGCLSGSGTGGFNGGGNGGQSINSSSGYYEYFSGDGGGGASDVRQGGSQLANRVVVAGGGGGAGGLAGPMDGVGGPGGGKIGGRGIGPVGSDCIGGFGRGGIQTEGGKGGRGASKGENGALGQGGLGGQGTYVKYPGGGGGGGAGGGYYGGGGGGSSATCHYVSPGGGGGGGSSFVEPGATNVKAKKGAGASGNGKITISW
jgi:hypothetical protein